MGLVAIGSAALAEGADTNVDSSMDESVVLPMMSVVAPNDDDRHLWAGIGDVLVGIMEGEPEWTAKHREPPGPIEPTLVACNETKAIGVVLLISKDATGRAYTRKLRIKWEHLQGYEEVVDVERFQFPGQRLPDNRSLFVFDHLALSKARRVDGIWQVSAFFQGELVHRESFQLYDCGVTRHPDWYISDQSGDD